MSDGGPGSVARSLDAGETWHEIADRPGARAPDDLSETQVDRLFGEHDRSEACGADACYRAHRDTLERRSGDRTETLPLADPRRDIHRRRQRGAHVCASGDLPRSTDVEVVTAPSGGERVVIGRGLEGVVLVDGDTVRPVAILGAAPPQLGSVTLAVIEPELAVLSVIAVAAWLAASVTWWDELERLALRVGTSRPWRRRLIVLVMLASAAVAAPLSFLVALGSGPAVGWITAAATVGTGIVVAWLVVPLPPGGRVVPWSLAARVALPWLAGVAAVSSWAAGWVPTYAGMLMATTAAVAAAFEIARRVAPLPEPRRVGGR